jgi:hypothetical protein
MQKYSSSDTVRGPQDQNHAHLYSELVVKHQLLETMADYTASHMDWPIDLQFKDTFVKTDIKAARMWERFTLLCDLSIGSHGVQDQEREI